MKMSHLLLAAAIAASAALPTTAQTHATQTSPIPGIEGAVNVPGATELPDPTLAYKVFFEVGKAAPTVDTINPDLQGASAFVNTLASYGVDRDHRKIVVLFDGDATWIIQNDAAFKAQNAGHANPNIALIQSMAAAGVTFHVCGQAVMHRKINPAAIQPEIKLDLAAWVSIANWQLRGYVRGGDR